MRPTDLGLKEKYEKALREQIEKTLAALIDKRIEELFTEAAKSELRR